MALGDGIRRDIATVSVAERNRFRDAIIALNQRFFPGDRTDFPAGHVSHWFKQDEIHQATHVHGGPNFLPWHRELCNRFEALLRAVDPELSLHYWDWNTDPAPLFTATFMGSANGDAGDPWLSAGFYDPNVVGDNYRDNSVHGLNPNAPAYPLHANPADPPKTLTRGKPAGAPPVGQTVGGVFWPTDSQITGAGTWQQLNDFIQGCEMGTSTNCAHGMAHTYIGGTIQSPHTSFRDPFVFLLHSNLDRLWAMWQTQPGHATRLDPSQVYESDGLDPNSPINAPMQPWAGETNWTTTGGWPVRPWYVPENQQTVKTAKDVSVVMPPCYDTLPTVPASVTLVTASINFNDVPVGETAARAIVFSAISCGDVHLSTAGPTVLTGPAGTSFGTFPLPLGTSVTIPHISSSTPPIGRLWISYKGTGPLDVATGTVTVHCAETNQDFVVPIAANTIARPTVAVMLVLDQSGSMGWLAGVDATTKRIDVLHQAAAQFVQLAQDSSRVGDAVGMVSFDHNAYPGVGVTTNVGTGFDLAPVVAAIQALQPAGATSIGNGVALGRNTLNPAAGFNQKAMVVFTDGLENTPLFIADVMGSINNRTFAIGLGTAQQVSVGALTALANNTGGRLLLSGPLSPSIDDYFRLSKFFMQVLAGVTNTSIVTDPSGSILPGMKVRIPFVLTETDIDSTVILLVDLPAIRFFIETPAGDIMDPTRAAAVGATHAVGTNMSYYRFTLPLPLGGHPAQEGVWHALLQLDEKIFERYARASDQSYAAVAARIVHGVRYSLIAQANSNLRMHSAVAQNSLQPGATLTIRTALSEYGVPVDHRASVYAGIERPDNSQTTVALSEIEPGSFEATTVASLQGVYRFRTVASGVTMHGLPFTREQLLSAAVVPGGDNPFPTSGPSNRTQDQQLCELLECLLRPEILGRLMTEHHIDPNALRACIESWCKERLSGPSEAELREREGTVVASAQSTGPVGPTLSSEIIAAIQDIFRKYNG